MEYPIRHTTHIIEQEAIDILNDELPKEWIIREITERDYGIDLYVEIVRKNKKVTGDLIAIQVKGKSKIDFTDNNFTFYGIQESTLNYWLGLPAPVFFIVACLETKKSYWCNIKRTYREGKLKKGKDDYSIKISNAFDLSEKGLLVLKNMYLLEKRWPDIENAIKNSLMLFTSLGPFCLICKRKPDNEYCSSSIQYILLQHYEYFYLLSFYLYGRPPEPVTVWYRKHIEMEQGKGYQNENITFSFELIKEIIRDFIGEYRECIRLANLLVVKDQVDYFYLKQPLLQMHLKARPLTFVEADWYPRYFFDEYEDETKNIEKKYFEDFTAFDNHDLINDLNV